MNIHSIINNVMKNQEDKDISNFFKNDAADAEEICRSINTAFMISLCGSNHKNYNEADKYLKQFNNTVYKDLVEFYLQGKKLLEKEIETLVQSDKNFSTKLAKLNTYSMNHKSLTSSEGTDALWSVFFP